jgi:hypothetical protein
MRHGVDADEKEIEKIGRRASFDVCDSLESQSSRRGNREFEAEEE